MDPRQALIQQMMAQNTSKQTQGRMPYNPGPNPGTTEQLDAMLPMMTPSPDQQMMQRMPMMPQEPQATIPDQMTDEDMLDNVHSQMGTGESGEHIVGEDMQADQAAVEAAPTDGNISAFVDIWGEENLPDSMKNPDNNADDYARGGD